MRSITIKTLALVLVLANMTLLAPGALVAQVDPVVVDIDFRPGNDVNPINVKSHGNIKAAILCSPTFDPASIDTTSVMLGGAAAQHCTLEDVNADACIDLVCHFPVQDIGVVCGDTEVTLTGTLADGTAFAGADSIRTVACKEKPAKAGKKK